MNVEQKRVQHYYLRVGLKCRTLSNKEAGTTGKINAFKNLQNTRERQQQRKKR